ncbi:hypothetical protein [Paenibacillus monticola]|uniref:Uncharacterized protein n=1 Tax=Paenibacillus monticola TaxID=2666075 RepID=A0A7X2L4D2_9BACL|nr:hypothetical protein [Paenibacillus monticola]MRN55251.1 hypothetical protein [Paenibacillus monticola]
MTYCLAWRKKNKLFMIADSAISMKSNNDTNVNEFSSFGEFQEKDREYLVYENQNKLIIIDNKYVICYAASDIKHAFEVIQLFKDCISYGIEVIEAINTILNSISYTDVQLLIGYSESDEVKLLLFDLKTIKFGDCFEIGSVAEIEEWTRYSNRWISCNLADGHELVMTIAYLQMKALKHGLLKHGAGGTFSGIELTRSEIKWCPDLNYCLLDSMARPEGIITVINRENILCTSSTYNRSVNMFINMGVSADQESRLLDTARSCMKILEEVESDYLILTNMNQKKVLILYIDKWLHNKVFNLWKRNREKEVDYLLALQPIIYDLLFTSKYGDDDDLTVHCMEANTVKTEYISLIDFEKKHNKHSNVQNPEAYY